MDPVTLIVTALVAGAASGVQDSASKAVSEAYAVLRAKLAQHFRGRTQAEGALAGAEEDPDTWRAPLAKEVERSGAADDGDVLASARALLELLDARPSAGTTINVAGDATGIQTGHHSTQYVTRHDRDR